MKQAILHGSETTPYDLLPDNNPPMEFQAMLAPGKKKRAAVRLWMRFDCTGASELLECDRNMIMRRSSIPARDLRVLGPLFSQSSNILAREKALLVNLEFIKAIVTAEEVYLLDPTNPAVMPFVDQLRQQLLQSPPRITDGDHDINFQETQLQVSINMQPSEPWPGTPMAEELQNELPFEFRVLEIALEAVCSYLDTKVEELEQNAYSALDELTKHVSTGNLEHVRSLKSHLTSLTARVQKVRDEFEHLLDDDEDMADMYLTRKLTQWHPGDSSILAASHVDTVSSAVASPRVSQHSGRLVSNASVVTITAADGSDVEDLEMLLEAYFMQIDGTRNKLLALREYIDDTEDYINIQLDNHRNQLIQLQLILAIAAFTISCATSVAGMFGMNIPCPLYSNEHAFVPTTFGSLFCSTVLFFLITGYARWKELLGT
ncbi:hypothetical protein O6H91_01G078600 [Diphasiastrum complanatum]|uniref:Uncharacterized protein n=1 Tax=Diphasiastrum complanatum TaxID=34168 RepID=A0ACC2ESP2_DIPCM|nr:hypothetical protein O6H91_01G078600 [Diphasiastrum complanatum]